MKRTRTTTRLDWDDGPWRLPAGWHVVLDGDGHLEEVNVEVASRTTGEPLTLHFETRTAPPFRSYAADVHLIVWSVLHEVCETIRYDGELVIDPHTHDGWQVVEKAANLFFEAVREPGEVRFDTEGQL